MPELPEVEGFKKYFDQTSLGATITQVEVLDDKVIRQDTEAFVKDLAGQKMVASERIGKYIFVSLGSGKVWVVHFGMTGRFKFVQNQVDQPEYTRVLFHLDQGYLAYECPRKFGRLRIADSIEAFREEKKLSKDMIKMTWEEFQENLKGRSAAIKTTLLDQKVCAGVGNWIADEVLFQAKIHPLVRVHELDEAQQKQIFAKLKEIIQFAIEKEANYDEYPRYYMVHRRGWTDLEPAYCEQCSEDTEYIKVGGRGTYLCPDCQILPQKEQLEEKELSS